MPDQCQSASEFLLEPWVLLQLPFQPSLLHQWTVALLAETLKFQKDTVTIFIIGVPKELLEAAQLLKNMAAILLEGVFTLMSVFCKLANGVQQNICKRFRLVRAKLLHTLSSVTPIVEFILSDKCKNVISGIKRASWGSMHKQQDLHTVDMDEDFGSFRIWYNAMFWTNDKMPKKLFSEQKFPDDHYSNCVHNLSCELMLYSKKSLAFLKKIVDENIIKKGVLVGASDAEILAVVASAPKKLQFPWSEYFKYPRGSSGQSFF
jgi:hypothetical protein